MQIRVRGCIVLAALLTVAIPPTTALANTRAPRPKQAPTQAQIRADIRAAETSRGLWATVNICNSTRYPFVLGIRGQMPGLGIQAKLQMAISAQYWSFAHNGFVAIPGSTQTLNLGSATTGLHQSGVTFQFTPHAGYLRGAVTFTWSNGKKIYATASRTTSRGHHDADLGDPAGYSSWDCVIT